VWKLENIPLYEVSVSRKRPRKEVRLQVTLDGGYSSRVSDRTSAFQTHAPATATGKAQLPIVVQRVDGTSSAGADAERSRLLELLSLT